LNASKLRSILGKSSESEIAILSIDSLNENIIRALAKEFGYKLFHLNGFHIRTKNDLVTSIARIMEFPDYFGHNWDALEECLKDLEWLPAKGYILLFPHPTNFINNSPADFETFTGIAISVSKYWAALQIRFLVILMTENEQEDLLNQ
jgi:RNAse (barnase) inhibitor barstar